MPPAAAAAEAGADQRLTVVEGRPLPSGWTGKVWAQKQGIDRAASRRPDYLLLTDADITYAPDVVRRLVSRAVADGLVLTSIMAKLHCESLAERFIIPAFIFFFRMLYPFAWVNRPSRRTAAAAGGCMLVRADALATRAEGGDMKTTNCRPDETTSDAAGKTSGLGAAASNPERRKPSEDAIARGIEQMLADKFIYDHTRGQWLRWNGSTWRIDETGLH